MDNSAASDLLDDLTTNIDTLTTTLQPVLSQSIHETASSLPLLDTAKLYTLTTYAIESILLAYERLHVASNPDEAHAHPILAELKRVQHSMQKIAAAENPETETQKPTTSIDKAAAARFIKAGLAMNGRYDEARAQQQKEGRQEAKRKLDVTTPEEAGEEKKKKKKKSKRSSEAVLDVPEKELEIVKGTTSSPAVEQVKKEISKKKHKKSKSKSGGEAT
jgi:exosome complex protein LRP1